MLCVSFGSDSAARLPSTPGADSRISPVCYYICLVLCVLYSAYCGRLHQGQRALALASLSSST
jgi:hypothetical protein